MSSSLGATMRIKTRISVTFFFALLIPLLILGSLSYTSSVSAITEAKSADLNHVVDLKKEFLEHEINDIQTDLLLAREFPTLQENLQAMIFYRNNRTRPTYFSAKKNLDSLFEPVRKLNGYADIMIAAPDGKIVYSSNPLHSITDLDHPFPDQSNRAFEQGGKTLYIGDVYENTVPSETYRFGMLATAPIFDHQNHLKGVLAFELSMDPLYEFIEDPTGLGQTGETLIGKRYGHTVMFLTPTRFDPNAALKRAVPVGAPNAQGIQLAALGYNGAGTIIDYRGMSVLSAWRHIPMTDWGIVVKQDISEAFIPARNIRNIFLVIGALALLVVLGAASIIQSTITTPVEHLTHAAAALSKGQLDTKINPAVLKSKDEIGELARAINRTMTSLRIAIMRRMELKGIRPPTPPRAPPPSV